MRHWPLLSIVLTAACAGPNAGTPAPTASVERDEIGSSRASREAAPADEPAENPGATVGATETYVVTHVGARRGVEDGHGGLLDAADAIAIDLDSSHFPARALDPVLHVGERTFVHYEYVEPGFLRFVLDASALAGGDVLFVQYGDDLRSRTELVEASSAGAGDVAP